MYLGFYKSQCTQKNQLTFPGKFTHQTGSLLFIAHWFENSLLILPEKTAEKTLKTLIAENITLLPEARDLERFIFGNAETLKLDSKNRFVLSKKLREYARIGKNAVFVGVNERIELWDEEVYANYGQIRQLQIRETAINLYNRIQHKNK